MNTSQSFKLFDAKFIAINLKNVLHCPKCHFEYSWRFDKNDSSLISHRPFLLGCGHSMCENCISRQGLDLMCATCSAPAPPTKNSKHCHKSSKFNVRDFFDPNFHMIGELFSNIYFLRYNSVNNSLNLSAGPEKLDVSIQTKCSECENYPAAGQCHQCNAYYCKLCFNKIHMHSNVLKAHKFDKLDDISSDSSIRIDSMEFKMPKSFTCRDHKNPKTSFCRKCQKMLCNTCVRLFHTSHGCRKIIDENKRKVSEIPGLLESVGHSRDSIANSQKIIQSAENQLKEYATQALSKIEQHFQYLHGLLQSEELRMTESLREKCLEPQTQLRHTLSKLNDYERVLSNMHEKLTTYQMQLPDDINLRQTLNLFSGYLDKIPRHVNVSKIAKNPFIFKMTMEAKSNKSNAIKFNDPNLQIQFVFPTGLSKYNTATSNYSLEQQERKNNYSIKQRNAKYEKNQSNSHSKLMIDSMPSPTSSTHENSNDVENPFMRAIQPARLGKTKWNLSVDARLFVTNVLGPNFFFVQSEEGHKFMWKLSEEFESMHSLHARVPIEIVAGNIYMMHDKKRKMWCRTKIIEMVKMNAYKVLFVDVGMKSVIETNNHSGDVFYELDDKSVSMPRTALPCAINDIVPFGKKWSAEATTLLKEIIAKYQLRLRFVEESKNNDQVNYYIDINADTGDWKFSVRDAFLYTGLAKEKPGQFVCDQDAITSLNRKAPMQSRIPKMTLTPGMSMKVIVKHIENPGEFYIVQNDMIKERDNLCEGLNNYFENLPDSGLQNIYLGLIGMGCIVSLNGNWHRGCIEQIQTGGNVLVLLVDHGRELTVHWRELYVLPKKFQAKEFALKCSLADIEPLQCDNYIWSTEAIREFKQLSSNPGLHLEAVCTANGVHNIILRIVRYDETINIATALVNKGYVNSTGPCSVMSIKETSQPNSCSINLNLGPLLANMQSNRIKCEATKKPTQQTQVFILHIVDPSEFYVCVAAISDGVKTFEKQIQLEAANTKESIAKQDDDYVEECIWRENDHCLVKTRIEKSALWQWGSSNDKWYRGIITAVPISTIHNKKITTYKVYLRDYGITVEGINADQLLEISERLNNYSNCAQRCDLACLTPPEVLWSKSAMDYFKDILSESENYFVNVIERKQRSLSVLLYCMIQKDDDPIAPATKTYINVNERIANAGFAIYKLPKNINEAHLQNERFFDDGLIKEWLSKVDVKSEELKHNVSSEDSIGVNSDSCDINDHLESLRDDANTATTLLPTAWQKPRPLNKTIFTAKPTYVDYNADVYAHLPNDKDSLQMMKIKLFELYKETFESELYIDEDYANEQPCVAIYHTDKCYYRGIIKKKLENNEYLVYFVDYGNTETIDTLNLIPYAPLPKLHSMCICLRMRSIMPKNATGYTTLQLDTLHNQIVNKLVSVTIADTDFIKSSGKINCNIRHDAVDVAQYLVDLGFAEFTKSSVKNPRNLTALTSINLTQSDTIENLEIGDSTNRMDTLVENFENLNNIPNNTFGMSLNSQHSPPSKKPMFDWNQLKQYNNSNHNISDSQQYSTLQTTETASDANRLSDNSHNKYFNTVSGYCGFDEDNINEQVKNRERLQLEDKNDYSKFCPFDSSTVISLVTNGNAIKPQELPRGVTKFHCSVDSVISATELQIFPNITELRKRDIALAREIASIVKLQPNLTVCETNMLVLAYYPRDHKWYRGIVRTYYAGQRKADVLYIDFINSETLPIGKLRKMPKSLLNWPLRSLRVKLHNVTPNPKVREAEVRKALHRCIVKSTELYARVVKPTELMNANISTSSNSTISITNNQKNPNYGINEHGFPGFLDDDRRIDTVMLFEREDSKFPIYQKLIDKKIYITNDD